MMPRTCIVLAPLCAAAALLFAWSGQLPAQQPVPLIFDTDIGNDVDDVLALGVIHALESRGQCKLLAVTITKDNALAAEFVSAVNTFYGRGTVPVGLVHDGLTKEEGRFLKLARTRDGDQLRYPHTHTGDHPQEATRLLRQVLAEARDASVVIVQVGFSTNVARLLASPADDISNLPGVDLVRQKVRLLSLMAGAFSPAKRQQRFLEYNVKVDIESARQLISKSPVPIVFSGHEIGTAVPYPAVSIERDYGYVPHHPLAEAYQLYNPPPHNRPTWDLTSVLYAVLPDRGYFGLSEPGRVTVEDDGFTRFDPGPDGPHRYLTLGADQIQRVTEALVQLSSQPVPQASSHVGQASSLSKQ